MFKMTIQKHVRRFSCILFGKECCVCTARGHAHLNVMSKKGKSVNITGHNKIIASPLLYSSKGWFQKKAQTKNNTEIFLE